MVFFLFRIIKCHRASVPVLLLLISLILAACSDETPSPVPENGPGPSSGRPETTPIVTNSEITSNPSTPEDKAAAPAGTVEADPALNYTPGDFISVGPGSPVPRPNATPTPTPNFGKLPVPPRTLVPQPTVHTGSSDPAQKASLTPIAKGNFVVATGQGLFLLNENGQGEQTLLGGVAFSGPKISPVGTHIGAFRTDPVSLRRLFVLLDTQGVSKTLPGEGGVIIGFNWSPDGKSLALVRARDTNNDGQIDENDKSTIWVYNLSTGKQQQIGEGRSATWSPDGQRLAFLVAETTPSVEVDPGTHLLKREQNSVGVYNVATTARRLLVSSKDQEISLAGLIEDAGIKERSVSLRYFKEVSWHPDSQHITVSADAGTSGGQRLGLVLTITLENTAPHPVTAGGEAGGKISWANDGKFLAFETEPQFPLDNNPRNGRTIGVLGDVSLTVGKPTRLFLGDPAIRNFTSAPAWLNNGQKLAFIKGASGVLTVTNSDGKDEQALVSGCTGFDYF